MRNATIPAIFLALLLSACGGGGDDSPSANRAPVVMLSADPTDGSAPLEVTFTATATDPDGDVLAYVWTFGDDGSQDGGTTAVHTYAAGTYTATVTVSDGRGGDAAASATVTATLPVPGLNVAPVAAFTAVPDAGEAPLLVTLDAFSSADPDGAVASYDWDFGDGSVGQGRIVSHRYETAGPYSVTLTVTDNLGASSAPVSRQINVTATVPGPGPNLAPVAAFTAVPDAGEAPLLVTLDASLSADPDGAVASYSWDFGDGSVGQGRTVSHQYETAGSYSVTLTVTDNLGASSAPASRQIIVTALFGLPSDPEHVAPAVDATVATPVAEAIAFLYTGTNPIQTGVAPGTIEPRRASALRGTVRDADRVPLAGVLVTVLGHPELGATRSRDDGRFDLAVNGGGFLTLQYEKDGFLTSQRPVDIPWGGVVEMPEVLLVPLDSQVTTVHLGAAAPPQVARGSVVTDEDGIRQATLVLAAGTQASLTLAGGSEQAVASLRLRATEFTVGPDGPLKMPAPLPPTSGYTYAVDLSADEAIAAGASRVNFSRPLHLYVENFLNFPVGESAPAGYYDQVLGTWVASDSGRVIRVLGATGGMADVDSDGDGSADTALDLDDDERGALASLYAAGQTLWRVPIPHLTP